MTWVVSMDHTLSTPPRSETKKSRLFGPHVGMRLTVEPADRLILLLALISMSHKSADAGRVSVLRAHCCGFGTVANASHCPSRLHAGLMHAARGVEATSVRLPACPSR